MEDTIASLRALKAGQRATLKSQTTGQHLYERFVAAFETVRRIEHSPPDLDIFEVKIPGTCQIWELPPFQLQMAYRGFSLAPNPAQTCFSKPMQYMIWANEGKDGIHIVFTMPKDALCP